MIAAIRRRGTLLANLAVLLVLLLGMYHVGANILRLQLGRDPFTVQLQLAETGGLYERSEVAYRGKRVGAVTDVRLRPGGAVADLRIDEGTRIPADLDAVVANLSAAGEQFVDLRPRRVDGPVLAEGSVIPADRTTTPVQTAVVVRNLAKVLDQVGSEDLRTVVDELALALDGTGPALGQLVNRADELLAALQESLPATINVLRNGRTNLNTANELGGQFEDFTASLRTLTRQLRETDPKVRRLLETGPGGVGDINDLVTTLRTPVAALLGNLITPGNLITARLPALNALLIAFPQATGALRTTARDGQFRVALYLSNNPTCDYTGPRRSPVDPTRVPPDLNRVCTDTSPGVGVRGAQNAPRSAPSGPQPGLEHAGAGRVALAVGGYDLASGVIVLPDGSRLSLPPIRGGGPAPAALTLLLALLRS